MVDLNVDLNWEVILGLNVDLNWEVMGGLNLDLSSRSLEYCYILFSSENFY